MEVIKKYIYIYIYYIYIEVVKIVISHASDVTYITVIRI